MTKGVLVKYLYNRWRPLLIGRIHRGKGVSLAAESYGLEGTSSHAGVCRRSGVTPSYAVLIWDNSAMILGDDFWWRDAEVRCVLSITRGVSPCRKLGLAKCSVTIDDLNGSVTKGDDLNGWKCLLQFTWITHKGPFTWLEGRKEGRILSPLLPQANSYLCAEGLWLI